MFCQWMRLVAYSKVVGMLIESTTKNVRAYIHAVVRSSIAQRANYETIAFPFFHHPPHSLGLEEHKLLFYFYCRWTKSFISQ